MKRLSKLPEATHLEKYKIWIWTSVYLPPNPVSFHVRGAVDSCGSTEAGRGVCVYWAEGDSLERVIAAKGDEGAEEVRTGSVQVTV